jgi:4-alpha-glucanotransferase
MSFDRQAGIFHHVTALPGPHGIGDLGAGARTFLDALDRSGQSLWQLCPLGPTVDVHGHSPYQSLSAFAGNPLLIDLRDLVERGLLSADDVEPPEPFPTDRVEYDRVARFKRDRLRRAFETFQRTALADQHDALETFRQRESTWLEDYALFRTLRDAFDRQAWTDWPEALRRRDPGALAHRREEHNEEIRFRVFCQWLFDEQWRALRAAAGDRDVDIVGDLPIYVALDSADVWANPDAFDLTPELGPAAVAGVPPNPGDDGQRWGNPVYDWSALAETDYDWWVERVRRLLELVDVARIDHFKGFESYWAIPADAQDPGDGEWREGPGGSLFERLEAEFGSLPFLVEDLGFLDQDLAALRDRFDFPGMRVVQYADWCAENHRHKPAQYPPSTVAYTSTHDTDTVRGYYGTLEDRQRECLHYALATDGEDVHWDLLESVYNSNANVAMTTVPDVLGLGSEARFNTPGTIEDNWTWRAREDQLEGAWIDRLGTITETVLRS